MGAVKKEESLSSQILAAIKPGEQLTITEITSRIKGAKRGSVEAALNRMNKAKPATMLKGESAESASGVIWTRPPEGMSPNKKIEGEPTYDGDQSQKDKINIYTAMGEDLDSIGESMGCQRRAHEIDKFYRRRIVDEMTPEMVAEAMEIAKQRGVQIDIDGNITQH